MKRPVHRSALLMPLLLCAAAPATWGNTPLAEVRERAAQIRVAEAPLVLSDFDLGTRRLALAGATDAALVGGALSVALTGPEKIVLPRAGGTTAVTLGVRGLSLSVRAVTLPSGITVTLAGNQLSVTSAANRGTSERFGSIAVMAQSAPNPRGGRVRGVLLIGLSQLPCTATSCPADPPPPPPPPPTEPVPEPSPASALASTSALDWSAMERVLRRRAADANAVVVVLDGSESQTRTSGAAIGRLARSCSDNSVTCILEVSGSDAAAASSYFLSPDVHGALYGNEASLMLSLRGEQRVTGRLGAIDQLRAAGLGHALLVGSSGGEKDAVPANAREILAADSHRNTLFAVSNQAISRGSAATVPTVVVPQALIVDAPLNPVDFEINGSVFAVNRSLAAFDAGGGSASFRFLQSGGLRWAVRKLPNSFVQGGGTFPQSGVLTLSVGPSSVPRTESVEFSAKTASGAVTLFIDVAVIQDPTGSIF
jgi:hypothetical protein